MDQIIILDGKTVYLVSETGSARWVFDTIVEARELYELLVLSCEVEDRIAVLCNINN